MEGGFNATQSAALDSALGSAAVSSDTLWVMLSR